MNVYNDILCCKDNGGAKSICAAIIMQAITDYKSLNNKGVQVSKDASGKISKNEITMFFRSSWCEKLLDIIGSSLDGEQIIAALHSSAQPESKTRAIGAFSFNGELVATFNTLPECANFAGLKSTGDICKCCIGKRKSAGGYVWKYI